ncbi:MAG: ATP synthase F0 subunit B [Candidatus Gastranaerophilaceae bacterium]
MEFNATFIVSAISFIVFSLIMNAIFYKPLSKVVAERQKVVDEHYEEAKLNKEKSEKILKDKERKLEKTKHEAKKIIVEKADEVKAQKAVLTAEAQKKAGQKIDVAKEGLQKSQGEAQAVLAKEVKNLAMDISSKILGEQI